VTLKNCLDVGCGVGWFSERLLALGLKVEALDGRQENVAEARRRVAGVRFHVANIAAESEMASFPRYDLVFCFGVMYHTEVPLLVVRNLRRLTKKILLLETIVIPRNGPCAWLVEEGENETQGLTFHAFIPSRTCMLKMLQVSGFEHVYEYLGPVKHEDFEETLTRHRKRRVFLASSIALSMDRIVLAPQIAARKYAFAKR
jgi:2-polyprenyl-3-methyl-5-hydroxy-6-metoxy-1,4-benzoquinol methylase